MLLCLAVSTNIRELMHPREMLAVVRIEQQDALRSELGVVSRLKSRGKNKEMRMIWVRWRTDRYVARACDA